MANSSAQAAKEINTAAKHANASANHAKAAVEGKANEILSTVEEISRVAREAAHDKVVELREMGEKQAKEVRKMIKNDPLKALMISVGVGFALGFLLTKRNG